MGSTAPRNAGPPLAVNEQHPRTARLTHQGGLVPEILLQALPKLQRAREEIELINKACGRGLFSLPSHLPHLGRYRSRAFTRPGEAEKRTTSFTAGPAPPGRPLWGIWHRSSMVGDDQLPHRNCCNWHQQPQQQQELQLVMLKQLVISGCSCSITRGGPRDSDTKCYTK